MPVPYNNIIQKMLKKKNIYTDLSVVILIALFSIGFFYKLFFIGTVFLPADLLQYMEPWKSYLKESPSFHNSAPSDGIEIFYPYRVFLRESIRKGIVPLWNPYNFSGAPFAANNQSAIFYPFNFLFFLLFPASQAFGYSALFHLFISGLFAYLFLRILKTNRIGAIIGATAFMFNGWFVVWMHLPVFWQTSIWLPLILLFYELSIRKKSLIFALFAGVILGIQFLSGMLQISVYVLFAFAAYSFFRFILEISFSLLRFHVIAFLITLIIGFLIGSVQILPSIELLQQSHRVSHNADNANVVPLHYLITLFIPDFYGSPATKNNLLNPGNYIEWTGYVGVTTLILAMLIFLPKRQITKSPNPMNYCFELRYYAYFFFVLGIISLLLATGSPLSYLFYQIIPAAKFMKAGRILFLLPCCFAFCAAFGVDFLTRTGDREQGIGNREQGTEGQSPNHQITKLPNHQSPSAFSLQRSKLAPILLIILFILSFVFFMFEAVNYLTVVKQMPLKILLQFEQTNVLKFLFLTFVTIFLVLMSSLQKCNVGTSSCRILRPRHREVSTLRHFYNCLLIREKFQNRNGLKIIYNSILFLLVFYDIFFWSIKFNTFCDTSLIYPNNAAIKFLQKDKSFFRIHSLNQILFPNSSTIYGLRDIRGYESLYPKRYQRFIQMIDDRFSKTPFIASNVLDTDVYNGKILSLLGVKYILTSEILRQSAVRNGQARCPVPTTHNAPRTTHYAIGNWQLAISNQQSAMDRHGVLSLQRTTHHALRTTHLTVGNPQSLIRHNDIKLVFNKGIKIYKNYGYLPEAFLISNWEVVKDENKILRKVVSENFNPRHTVILEKPPQYRDEELKTEELKLKPHSVLRNPQSTVGSKQLAVGNHQITKSPNHQIGAPHSAVSNHQITKLLNHQITKSTVGSRQLGQKDDTVKIISYTPGEISLWANANKNALLYLNESYYPGWKVFVNGEQKEIYRSNYIFQSVAIEQGINYVKFLYDPISIKIGSIIGTICIYAVLGKILLSTVTIKRRRRGTCPV